MTTKNKKRKSQARRKPRTPKLPWNGDHGTSTAAATAGTVLEPLEGDNPNRIARRRHKSAIDAMSRSLTMRQSQAAKAIEEAWCRLQMCSSGGALKEQVDASPRPDASIARQVDAQSRWQWVTKALLRSERRLVDWVCCKNQSIQTAGRKIGEVRATERFRIAMDRVADHLKY